MADDDRMEGTNHHLKLATAAYLLAMIVLTIVALHVIGATMQAPPVSAPAHIQTGIVIAGR